MTLFDVKRSLTVPQHFVRNDVVLIVISSKNKLEISAVTVI